jgi:chromosome segregation ATPase
MVSRDDQSAIAMRRSLCEVAEQSTDLVAERYALEEVRDGLLARERDLSRRVAAAREDVAALEAEADAKTRRGHKIAAEVEAIRHETRTHERECSENVIRTEEYGRRADAVSVTLRAHLDGGEAVQDTLCSVRDSIVRMDRKLVFAERKRGGADQ